MSPLVFVGPLLVAHFVTPAREVRAHGVVVHATANEIDVTSHKATRRIRITTPADSIEILDAHTIRTHAARTHVTYVDGRETSSCRFVSAVSGVGTLLRTAHGKTTFTTVRVGPMDGDPCN